MREPILINSETFNSGKCSLPQHYTNVPAHTCQMSKITVPESAPINRIQGYLDAAKEEEIKWIQHGMQLLDRPTLSKEYCISWAAFHASVQNIPSNPPAITSLCLYFTKKPQPLAMVKHGMDLLTKITDILIQDIFLWLPLTSPYLP